MEKALLEITVFEGDVITTSGGGLINGGEGGGASGQPEWSSFTPEEYNPTN